MKILVGFKNPDTGATENVKCSWSWLLFFAVPLLGIPLFNRKLKSLGIIALLLWTMNFIVMTFMMGGIGILIIYPLLCITLGFQVWLGIRGNEFTAKKYLKLNYALAEPDSEVTKLALVQWRILIGEQYKAAVTVKQIAEPKTQVVVQKPAKSPRKDILIPFKKLKSGEIKRVKLGIAWTIFFFNFFGLVFFIRGVWSWGVIILAVHALSAIILNNLTGTDYNILFYAMIVFNAYVAAKGNEWTAKFYLNHGYEAYEPDSEETRLANSIWSIHQTVPEGWQPNSKLARQTSIEYAVFALIIIGELFLCYEMNYFIGFAAKNRNPSCSATITTDTIKKLLADHGVDVFEIKDITKLNATDKGVACSALMLTSKGSRQLIYTAEKMADGDIYVELH